MRLLVVSYWSLEEPLTASMVLPYLRILAERPDIEHIRFITIESSGISREVTAPDIPKTRYSAIRPMPGAPRLLAKAEMNLRAARSLAGIVREDRIDLILAASSMAGAPAHFASRRTGIPYAVYCFEPHADYMLECGEWNGGGLRYRLARRMERVQMEQATRIMTVTENYRRDLVARGYEARRFRTMPCVIDTAAFRYSDEARARVRASLGIPDKAMVGIYVGKFGGLYYDEEAFRVFRAAFDRFAGMHLIILSPMDARTITEKARAAGIPVDRLHVLRAPYAEVPGHLSAADLAFSTVRPGPSKRYQCPVKNGEYWAAGLPILMSDGIGDDHLLLRQGIGGAVFNDRLTDLGQALDSIAAMLERPGLKAAMHELAERTRSLDLARTVLWEWLDDHVMASGGDH